jgi:hypothetical protein
VSDGILVSGGYLKVQYKLTTTHVTLSNIEISNSKVRLYGYCDTVVKRKAFWECFKVYHSAFAKTAGPMMLQILKEIDTDQQQISDLQKVFYKLLANIGNTVSNKTAKKIEQCHLREVERKFQVIESLQSSNDELQALIASLQGKLVKTRGEKASFEVEFVQS